MNKKQIDRYNELLLKFGKDEEFIELLSLANNYFIFSNIEAKQLGLVFIDNTYERLIYDLSTREQIIKGGN